MVIRSRRGTGGHSVDVRDESSVARFFEGVGAFDHLAITAGDWDIPMRTPLAELVVDGRSSEVVDQVQGPLHTCEADPRC